MKKFSIVPLLLVLVAAGLAGCSSVPQIVPLLRAAGAPVTPGLSAPLEVVSRGTAVPDPLPVSLAEQDRFTGRLLRFSDLSFAESISRHFASDGDARPIGRMGDSRVGSLAVDDDRHDDRTHPAELKGVSRGPR